MEISARIENQLKRFIELASEKQHLDRTWIEDSRMKVYIRKGQRFLEGAYRPTFEIGAIDVLEEFQRRGLFRSFLRAVEKHSPWKTIFIENVLNHEFAESLLRNGWTRIYEQHPYSFFLKKI